MPQRCSICLLLSVCGFDEIRIVVDDHSARHLVIERPAERFQNRRGEFAKLTGRPVNQIFIAIRFEQAVVVAVTVVEIVEVNVIAVSAVRKQEGRCTDDTVLRNAVKNLLDLLEALLAVFVGDAGIEILDRHTDKENHCGRAEQDRKIMLFLLAEIVQIENDGKEQQAERSEDILIIDIRSIDKDAKAKIVETLKKGIDIVCKKRDIEYEIKVISDETPVPLSAPMVDYLSSICEDEGVSYKRMPSGAGHDTMFWAPYAPAGMLFIPCKDGISHNAAEHAEMDDIFCVTKLLEKAVKKLSQENFKI